MASLLRRALPLLAALLPRAAPLAPAAGDGARVFLRCSPLVGGPAFLPLHVEVIVAPPAPDGPDDAAAAGAVWHRFDFLPARPTDAADLRRLATLRPVPGRVRCRTAERGELTTCDRGATALVPIGRAPPGVRAADVAAAARRFAEGEGGADADGARYGELRLVGGKNW